MKNLSGESKKTVICGICGESGRRDNMKSKHFPRKHKGVAYCEKGDASIKKHFQTVPSDDDPMEEDDDKKQDKVQEGGEYGTRVEDEEISVQEEVIQVVSDHDRIANIPREIVDMLEPVLKKNMEDVIEAVTKLQIQQKEKKPEEKFETKQVEESNENANDANLVLLQIKSCRTINDLCIYASLTPYRYENQLVCDLCDEANESSIRKAGEFHFISLGYLT